MKIFISHASEDKEVFVRGIAWELRDRGIEVWYDEYVLRMGDGLREAIDNGLATCDYGIVVVSSAFFAKQWPKAELDALFGRALGNRRRFLLPIRHGVSLEFIQRQSPLLASRFIVDSAEGVSSIVGHILQTCVDDDRVLRNQGSIHTGLTYSHRYFNPPGEVPRIGYQLRSGTFAELQSQLRPREVILAYGRPYGTHEIAAHVMSEERMLELERDFWLPPDYFAVDVRKALAGFDNPLTQKDLESLLGKNRGELGQPPNQGPQADG